MTELADSSLKTPQREIQRLLGRCLLRLQQYEHLIKIIVAQHELSGSVHGLEKGKTGSIVNSSGKTLGNLVRDLLGSYVVTDASDIPDDVAINSKEGVSSFSMKMQVALPEAEFARTESGLKELVLLRNNLVHHFIDEHDLWSLNGCQGASDSLAEAYNRIDQHFEQLREWAEDMSRLRRAMADIFQQDGFREMVINGINQDGTVYWPAAGIVYALRAAARELAIDGWTSVNKASEWVAERQPDQTIKKYGCSSWRQVVHESRLFDLKYFEAKGLRTAMYREKDWSSNSR